MRILIILLLAATIFGSAGYFTWFLFIKPQEELRLEKLLPPPPPPPDPTVPDFNRIVELQKADKLPEARAAFADFVERYPESTKLDEAKNRLGEMNAKFFLSRTPGAGKETYSVKPGDVISRVANRTKTTPELIMRVNGLNTIMLRIGQQLIIPKGDFTLTIDRKDRKVVVYNGGKFFKQYSMRSEPAAAAKSAAGATKKGASPAPTKLPKLTGRISDKISWHEGNRVTFADKGFEQADHWIVIQPAGHSLFTDRDVGPNEPKPQKPPGGGYGLASEPMHELAVLLNKNTPVTIE